MSIIPAYTRATTPQIFSGTVDPTNALDQTQGVKLGDEYFNTTSGNLFRAVAVAPGAAVWRHTPRVIDANAVAITHTGDTLQTALKTVAIPAGALGQNGQLEIDTAWSFNNTANSKTHQLFFGASGAGLGGTPILTNGVTSNTIWRDNRRIANRGAANAQYGIPQGTPSGGFGSSAGAAIAGSVNTANATEVVFAVTLTNAGDTAGLQGYNILLTRPDIT